ncbi:MAG: methyltransferase domain-containing protein [Phycisphaerales bacterium]
MSKVDAKSGKPLHVAACRRCGLVQQTPIPTEEELRRYYEDEYRQTYKGTHQPKPKHVLRAGRTALERIRLLKSMGIADGTLLDIGAGGGEFVALAAKAGFDASGIEPGDYGDYARRTYGCDVERGELSEATGTYDTVTIFHVMEHLPCPVEAFARIHRLLNPGGKLLVEVPWIEAADASPSNTYFRAHIYYFNAASLIAAASEFFEAEHVDTSSNLRVLLRARPEPGPRELPSREDVAALHRRLDAKSWVEYALRGGGVIKPLRKLARAVNERQARGKSGAAIIETLAARI